jgi:hypothetical protein
LHDLGHPVSVVSATAAPWSRALWSLVVLGTAGFGRTFVFPPGRASVGWFDPSRDHTRRRRSDAVFLEFFRRVSDMCQITQQIDARMSATATKLSDGRGGLAAALLEAADEIERSWPQIAAICQHGRRERPPDCSFPWWLQF